MPAGTMKIHKHTIKIMNIQYIYIWKNVKLLRVSVTSNHHQADISEHGHDMFSAYSMGSNVVYICCLKFNTPNVHNIVSHTVSTEHVMFMF